MGHRGSHVLVHPGIVRPDAYMPGTLVAKVVGGTTSLKKARVNILIGNLRKRCVVAVDGDLDGDALLRQDFPELNDVSASYRMPKAWEKAVRQEISPC